ncbi:MAG: cytochrome c [Bryobacteraceae bacterium]|nr:cytochrome c [Bryobacteraceae bacterium]
MKPRTAEQRASSLSGRELYVAYCASCHGMEGRGDGPAAEAMRMRPTDLTALARSRGGTFPKARVERLLGGLEGFPAHGGKRMPVWGPVFIPVSPADGHSAALIDRLVRYLESIQQPAAH